ncbi:hypothetical protein QE357_003075 [Siphonobacter sp. BAB-5404]|nr:hypothetical protein [Siphonobacter sp. SORGH_AS_1065]MDR6196023.1 hypothetical protein [Siphonobacter sp. SORGH_AS_0500]
MKTPVQSKSLAPTDYLIAVILIIGLLFTVFSFSQIH